MLHNTLLPGWVTPFLAGVFISTLVLTHDVSVGNDLIVRGLLRRGEEQGTTTTYVTTTTTDSVSVTSAAATDAEEAPPLPLPPHAHPAELPSGGGDDADADADAVIVHHGAFLVKEAFMELEAVTADAEEEEKKKEEESVTTSNSNNEDDGARASVNVHDDDYADDVESMRYRKLKRFADDLSTYEAFAAAMASSKLAMALWARALRPATNFMTFYANAGYQEFMAHSWRFLTTTDPKILAGIAATVVASVLAYAACVVVARHLKRARYVARLRDAAARACERVAAFWRRLTGPYVRAFKRVRSFGRTVTRRYDAFLAGVSAKSRRAAALAPHVILAGVGGTVIFFMPEHTRVFVRKREVVASVVLLVPTFLTVSALERCRKDEKDDEHNKNNSSKAVTFSSDAGGSGKGGGAGGSGGKAAGEVKSCGVKLTAEQPAAPGGHGGEEAVEAWLRFWASAAPLMLLIDLPFVARGLHLLFPFWPECAILWTAWLTVGLYKLHSFDP
jgi:hypothetical protein